MENSELTSVSNCGNYMACVTSDGQVQFWDTASSNLLSRFSFHRHSKDLSLQCVNIRWLHNSNTSVQDEISGDEPPRKRAKHDDSSMHPTRTEKLAAVGTTDGTVFIFNFLKQKLHTQFTLSGGHGTLLNFDYEPLNKRFFMLYSKSYLSQIDFHGNELKSFELDKNDFKFTKNDVRPVVYIVDENTVLIGKNVLAVIDWTRLEVTKTFPGNNSRITVCEVASPINVSNRSFLFFGTENGRTITVYDMKAPDEQYAFLSLDDSPTCLQVHISQEMKMLAFATTTSGQLLVYQEDIRGITKNKNKIFRRKFALSVSVQPKIDFGFVRWNQGFDTEDNGSMVYGFGSALNPNFGTLSMKQIRKTSMDRQGVINGAKPQTQSQAKKDKKDKSEKKEPEGKASGDNVQSKSKAGKKNDSEKDKKEDDDVEEMKEKKKITIVQENVQKSKIEAAKQNSKSVQVLGPALPNCNPLPNFEKESKARKEPKTPEEMTLEMRLELEERGLSGFLAYQEKEKEKEEKKIYRKRMHGVANKLVTALEQGLQNDNSHMLMTALLCPDRKTIRNTIAAMKYQTIVPLLNKLQVLAHSSDGNQDIYFNWLTMIIKMKLTYILQLPDKQKLFQSLFKLLKFKQNLFNKMSILHGRMNIMVESMRELNKPVKEALIRYETDSSDDENELEL